MAEPLLSTKKCPNCQQWSVWQQRSSDSCEHCGELLDPRGQQSALEREKATNQKMYSVLLIEIKPDDSALVRFFKTIIRGGQLLFAALMAFMVWLVTLAAG
jgi:predicted amidophosphoribosyltransferase